jgi:hypothetical protein
MPVAQADRADDFQEVVFEIGPIIKKTMPQPRPYQGSQEDRNGQFLQEADRDAFLNKKRFHDPVTENEGEQEAQ